MGKAGNYYDEDEEFSGFEGAGKPRNPKGLFVVPTGSVSMINVSSSIKGGSVGSTKDTLTLLTTLGTDYDEPWHEAVHYLDKRVSELSIGLNAVADSNTNLSGSVGALGATNKVKIGTTSTERSRIAANHSKVGITTSQASAITANSAKTGITPTQASRITANTAKTTISDAQASAITANTAKVGTETDLSVTEGITIKATVANSRGNYTLTFTMTHGETTKSATIKLL